MSAMATIESSFELDAASKRSLYKAFRDMDQGANQQLKAEVRNLVDWMANDIKAAAARSPFPKQATAVASTVRPVKDRIPYVRVGGEKRVTSKGTRAGDILIGAEFGGPTWFKNGGRRFPFRSPRYGVRGNAGYWIFPTLRRNHNELALRWRALVEQYVINPWGRNGS